MDLDGVARVPVAPLGPDEQAASATATRRSDATAVAGRAARLRAPFPAAQFTSSGARIRGQT
jgi:hypothetical protein